MASQADQKIIEEAKKRFRDCELWESQFRQHYKDDMRFAEGDSYNNWQWPAEYANDRKGKPSLTINKVRQHNLQIVNDARQNKPQIRIQPIADGASKEAAEVFEGVCRHIEYISDAQTAYDTATYHQVYGGIGYLRLVTEFADADSFDQEIYIRRVGDPLSVFIDPDIQRYDGADAAYGFIFANMKPDKFNDKYPKWKNKVGKEAFVGTGDDWGNRDNIRVAEYFRRSNVTDTLMEMPAGFHPEMPQGGTIRRSELTPELADLLDAMEVRSRPIVDPKIEWFKIAGSEIIERGIWPGSYIPIVRVVGEETVVEGKMDRKGHTRALMDSQRMYNFMSSAAAEFIALQSKTPYLMPMETGEEYGVYYENAHIQNRAWLPYKARDENQQPLPPPHKEAPPVAAAAYLQGMATAQNELLMASGQYQAEMGEPGNERSGAAINARQRQSDNATYHYVDHLAQAVRYLGRQIIDLIPKVYDTPRILRILGEDGSEKHVQLDPGAPKSFDGDLDNTSADEIQAIFNPNVGRFDVISDIGPAYATKRQEAFAGYLQIMQRSPDLMAKAGDIFFSQSDMPGAQALADRLEKFLPPGIADQGNGDPQVAALQQQLTQVHQAASQTIEQAGQQVAQLKQALADQQREQARKDFEAQMRLTQMQSDLRLKEYQAETARMQAVGGIDPQALKPVIRELVSQAMQTPIVPLMAQHAEAEQDMQPDPEPTTETKQ